MLNQADLFAAEGGNVGLALQMFGLVVGVGAVFASSTRTSNYFRNGALRYQDWLCLFGAGYVGYETARQISIAQLGNAAAYRNHWVAYSFVKACNRFEGRQILKKPPLMY